MNQIEEMKKAAIVLDAYCGDRCNAEYNPCAARAALQGANHD